MTALKSSICCPQWLSLSRNSWSYIVCILQPESRATDRVQEAVATCLLKEAFDKSIAVLLLSTVFLGFALSLQPQHEHSSPSHLINISHITHLLCPAEYLREPSAGLEALFWLQIPLHVINHTSHANM
jgi:hypothetical protein